VIQRIQATYVKNHGSRLYYRINGLVLVEALDRLRIYELLVIPWKLSIYVRYQRKRFGPLSTDIDESKECSRKATTKPRRQTTHLIFALALESVALAEKYRLISRSTRLLKSPTVKNVMATSMRSFTTLHANEASGLRCPGAAVSTRSPRMMCDTYPMPERRAKQGDQMWRLVLPWYSGRELWLKV
jgi:hypothetical protein